MIDKAVFGDVPRPILVNTSLKLFSVPSNTLLTLIMTEEESLLYPSILNDSMKDGVKLSATERAIASSLGTSTCGLISLAQISLRAFFKEKRITLFS
ncbi:hypothetical protein D3C86_1398090 [compost metagenome]